MNEISGSGTKTALITAALGAPIGMAAGGAAGGSWAAARMRGGGPPIARAVVGGLAAGAVAGALLGADVTSDLGPGERRSRAGNWSLLGMALGAGAGIASGILTRDTAVGHLIGRALVGTAAGAVAGGIAGGLGVGTHLRLIYDDSADQPPAARTGSEPATEQRSPTEAPGPPAQAATTSTAPPAPTTAPATSPATTSEAPVAPATDAAPAAAAPPDFIRVGDRDEEVPGVRARLAELGYALPPEPEDPSEYTAGLKDAVLAFQKVNGLQRDGIIGAETRAALEDPIMPSPAAGGPANRFEVDLSMQVAFLVRDGEIAYISNASSGNPDLPDGRGSLTPTGTWQVQWEVDGIRDAPLGRLWDPIYFAPGGIAVHGSRSVPAYPASHGCVRVPIWLSERVNADNPVGSTILVHE